MVEGSEQSIIRGAITAWQEIAGETMHEAPERVPSRDSKAELLTMAVRIFGAWEGLIAVIASRSLARRTAQRIFETDSVDDSMMRDILGELGNVIAGNVLAVLPSPSMISPPIIVEGDELSLAILANRAETRMHFSASGGGLEVLIAKYPAHQEACRVLVADGRNAWRDRLVAALKRQGHWVNCISDPENVLRLWSRVSDERPSIFIVATSYAQSIEALLGGARASNAAQVKDRHLLLISDREEPIESEFLHSLGVTALVTRNADLADVLREVNRIASARSLDNLSFDAKIPGTVRVDSEEFAIELVSISAGGATLLMRSARPANMRSGDQFQLTLDSVGISGKSRLQVTLQGKRKSWLPWRRAEHWSVRFIRNDAKEVATIDNLICQIELFRDRLNRDAC